ncbi:hypothetical protein ACIBAI_26385 [Streptomyces sp. NPDC051041]|uniref:hypothetical protein n=1 Tax=Streptomyces sp. NPDC051041 TaxID=3365640 RepID=UPI00379B2336
MDTDRNQGSMLGHGDEAGRAVAATGLWITLVAAITLALIGVFGMVAGLKPAVWVAAVGVIISIGTAVAVRSRNR